MTRPVNLTMALSLYTSLLKMTRNWFYFCLWKMVNSMVIIIEIRWQFKSLKFLLKDDNVVPAPFKMININD